ncbi:MAG TPA: hydrogen gas-evolving membrane-bound hydrogenase subunit E [Acidimicrobiia bacterium]|nr:hydrogen gas-evolving membrane-bound hydrogenase subunit E [Acidimicrobiia bacterium]
MIVVFAVHAAVALVCLIGGERLGRRALLVGAIAPASIAFVFWQLATSDTDALTATVSWLPALGLELDFRFDGFSVLMAGLICGVGVLVFLYSWSYFSERTGLPRFAAILVAFAGSMFGIVTADNLLLLVVFWELTSITSYLLIGFQDDSAGARASALQALLVTTIGGLAMLAGVVLLGSAAGTYSLSGVLAAPPSGTASGIGLALVLVGAVTKSAQVPFHFWLPGAMAAPTPVSTYLHSATMVKAGIYVVARFAPVFAVLVVWWRPTIVVLGLATMLLGGWRALAQTDLKLLLAQGTVSQLGFMMVLVGWGTPEMTFAGMAMLVAHGLFKGALFMIAGAVDHHAHTRDIRRLSGIGRELPWAFGMAAVAVAAMAGVPPLLGYASKEFALGGLVSDTPWPVTGTVVVGSMLTVAYGLRFLWGAFATKPGVASEPEKHGYGSLVGLLIPVAVLTVGTVVGGVLVGIPDALVAAAARSVDALSAGFHLALWHGFGPPVVLSVVVLLGGWLLWKWPLPVLRRLTSRAPETTRVYGDSLVGLNRVADRVVSTMQSGSLPVYLSVIVTVAVVAPGVLMVRHWRSLPEIALAESPLQVVAVLVVVAAAVAVTLVRRRLAAVLCLGAIGYGVAVLFLIQGAPDLALTQLLVETLALAFFVMVLSRLPLRFEVFRDAGGQAIRVVVASVVGLATMAFALWAASERTAPSLAGEFIARAEPEGGGRNVVNVILTDFRALDTLGEITVLVVAALGAMALIRAPMPADDTEPSEAGT